MEEVLFVGLITEIISLYKGLLAFLPFWLQTIVSLILFAFIIFLYSLFVWKGYQYISNKDLIELNLNQYNKTEHPVASRTLGVIFYFLEYLIIVPVIIFLSFTFFALFLIILNETAEISSLILTAAAIIAVIRMASYLPSKGEDLAKELAKLLPFMLLAVAMLNPGFFQFERILQNMKQIPDIINRATIYFLFIVFLEIFMRLFEFVFSVFKTKNVEEITTEASIESS
jgi:hypothetical protein